MQGLHKLNIAYFSQRPNRLCLRALLPRPTFLLAPRTGVHESFLNGFIKPFEGPRKAHRAFFEFHPRAFRSQAHGDNLLQLFCETTYSLYTKNSPWQSHGIARLPSADVFHVLKQPGCNKKQRGKCQTSHILHSGQTLGAGRQARSLNIQRQVS